MQQHGAARIAGAQRQARLVGHRPIFAGLENAGEQDLAGRIADFNPGPGVVAGVVAGAVLEVAGGVAVGVTGGVAGVPMGRNGEAAMTGVLLTLGAATVGVAVGPVLTGAGLGGLVTGAVGVGLVEASKAGAVFAGAGLGRSAFGIAKGASLAGTGGTAWARWR